MEFSAPREIRMSAHTSLDIFETGSMSSFVVEESPEPKERGTISTSETASRSNALAESHPEWLSKDAELALVDRSDESILVHYGKVVTALEDIEVAITAIASNALEKEKDVMKAGKAAGAKLSISTEFGRPTNHATVDIWSTETRLND